MTDARATSQPRPVEVDAGGDAEAAFTAEALRAESNAIARLADRATGVDASAWRGALDVLEACTGHVVVSGMGKSGLVGAKISATFSSLGQPSSVLHPSEAVHGDLGRVRRGDVVILLSNSGATAEVVDLALLLKADGMPVVGISKANDTPLARHATAHVPIGDVTEACPLRLAPTASTTAQLAVGDALALALARRRNFTADDFHRSHPGGALGAALRPVTEILRFRAGRELAVLPAVGSVREILDRAAEDDGSGTVRHSGAVLLVDDGGRLAGIFTDGDLRRLVLEDAAALDRPIGEVMTGSPKRLVASATVRDAVTLIREHRVDELPVVDEDDRPVGLLDVQDLVAMRVLRD